MFFYFFLSKKQSFFKWGNKKNSFVSFNSPMSVDFSFYLKHFFYFSRFLTALNKLFFFRSLSQSKFFSFFLPVSKLSFFYTSLTFFSYPFNSFFLFFSNIFYFKVFHIYLLKSNFYQLSFLPTQSEKYTVLRSPFVFKKGREQFERQTSRIYFSYSSCFKHSISVCFQKKLLNSSFLKHNYISN